MIEAHCDNPARWPFDSILTLPRAGSWNHSRMPPHIELKSPTLHCSALQGAPIPGAFTTSHLCASLTSHLDAFSPGYASSVPMVSSYSCNTEAFANKPQGDFIKTNLNNFLLSISGLEIRIPTLLLTQLLHLCLHFTAKCSGPGRLTGNASKWKGCFCV